MTRFLLQKLEGTVVAFRLDSSGWGVEIEYDFDDKREILCVVLEQIENYERVKIGSVVIWKKFKDLEGNTEYVFEWKDLGKWTQEELDAARLKAKEYDDFFSKVED